MRHHSRCHNPTLSGASEILLRGTLPSTADLQEILDGLYDKDSAFAKLDKQITDALNGEECGEEIVAALDFHDKIVKAISRLRSAMNAGAPVGSIVLKEDNHSLGTRVRARNPATPWELPAQIPPAKPSLISRPRSPSL